MGRRLAAHRRVLAAVLAALGTGFALLALQPRPAGGTSILIAARDLPSGTVLRHEDLRTASLPLAAVPAGALRNQPTGRVLAGPMRRGEPLTDVRLISSGLLNGYGPGTVAVPVRIADAGAVRLLHRGDRVDVLAPAPSTDELTPATRPHRARLIAAAAPVVAIPRPQGEAAGALIVLAADRAQAAALAGAGPHLSLTITKPW
ncbi:SAF domain-containing protein [Actinomadura vinacea]|uniref:SAF domain-containing protein n=1 Tax=Actinomadura vinacea TaxID=115336 RepID=UPI0031D95797